LRSIQETPEDDAPRLVYADWLDDHSNPKRADFIRNQCRLERTPRDAPQWRELRSREAELLKRHKSEWLGPWDSRSNDATFRRGFLDSFRIGGNFGIGLSSLAPALSPYHDLTRNFVIQANKLAEGLVPLLGEALPCLRRLELENCFRGNVLAEELAAWPASAGLTELVIRRSGVGSVGLVTLAQAPWLASLRSLDLRDNLFDRDALTTLLLCPALRGLEGLAINGRNLTGHALVPLLTGQLTALRHLRLQAPTATQFGQSLQGAFGDDGLGQLAASPTLERFTSLELLAQGIGDRGIIALAGSPHARNLTTLNLRNNLIGDAALAALADSSFVTNLTCLDLCGIVGEGRYGTAAALRLVESPLLRNLVTLRLSPEGSSGQVAEELLNPARLPKLRSLGLNVGFAGDLTERLRARGVELITFYHGD
jgi:uncharacterized protein (TIGR02996 family)